MGDAAITERTRLASMSDSDKTPNSLRDELELLRRRITELEARRPDAPCGDELEIKNQAIQSSISGIALSDLNGTITFVNRAFLRMWGYEDVREVLGRPAVSFWESAEEAEGIIRALGERGGWVGEMTAKRKNGELFPAQLSATVITSSTGRPMGMMASFIDITERRLADAKGLNIRRLYAFLSQINQAIVRIRDRHELFRTICQVAIEFGQFRMAWIGLVDEVTGRVEPTAHAGWNEGYLEMISIRRGDRPEGKGPTGSALQEGILIICDDIATDPRMHPWRTEALKRGYRSSASVPFRLQEKVIGTLNLYASEPDFFKEDERKLLAEIGVDITFALDNMERESERIRAEEALRESRERLQFVMSNSPAVIYTCRPSGDFGATFISPNVVQQLGYGADAFTSDPGFWAAHIHPDDAPRVFSSLSALFARGVHAHEYRFRHQDGTWRWMHDELNLIRNGAGEPVEILGSWIDITDRKVAEEHLLERTRTLATLLEVSKGLSATLNMEEVLQTTTDGATHLFASGTAAIYILEEDTLSLGATTPPLPPDFPEEHRIAPLADHALIGRAITTGAPVLVPDMMVAELTPAERDIARQRDLRTVLVLPLIAGEKSMGTLIVGSAGEPRAISEAEIDLCRTLANLAALAVENARLYKSVQQYADDLEQQIAERRQAEKALWESERKYRTLFDSATDAVFILDLKGNILDVNRTAHTRLGYTKQELLSMHVAQLDAPEYAARVPERLAQISRSGVAIFESAHIRKDGSVMPVEVNSRLLEYEGQQAYFSIIRDITDRKRVEEALRESEERFRTLLARVDSVAVQGFGPDGTIHYWNTASERLYGYTAEEAQGRSILDLIVPGETREAIADAIGTMAATGSPLPSSEATLQCKDGSCVTVHANYAVVNMPGRAPELYCIDIDITDRKQAEQERLELERRLLHAQKLESLGILAGGIAHDFNNLLMAVLGNLDLALRKISPVSPARGNIEQSAQAARRATDLTRQMLAYSGKGRFLVKAMDLSELVEENTHLFRASVARTATLDIRLDRSLPSIEADVGQVQQVIMNLITNASEAIGDSSGRITIATGVQVCDAQCLKLSRIEDVPPAGRFVYLEVSDTGCGMDEQTQQRLFDPFFTTKAPGRGLGMSAILGIVRGHGGAIFVESGPGRGTSIRILFPALEEARPESGATAGEFAAEAGGPAVSGTVLVVDDEEIVRIVCREMVEAMGLPVLTAVDGRDAVNVFTRHADSISHVILDLSMPNMDGMAAFTELVRIKPGVKIIMSSGYDEQESLQRLSGRGLAGFIQKPYSLKNLRDALEKT